MKKERMLYPEFIRIIAILLICFNHISSQEIRASVFWSSRWQISHFFNILISSWPVILFLMISGIFLLNPEKTITASKILKSYILRMLMAICIMVPLFDICYSVFYRDTFSISLQDLKHALITLLKNDGNVVYWFLYMMIGLYLVLPFLRILVKEMNQKTYLYLLAILFVTNCIIPYVEPLGIGAFSYANLFLRKLKLTGFLKYSGFLLAGWYIYRYPLSKIQRYIFYGIAVFSMGVTVFLARKASLTLGGWEETWTNDFAPGIVITGIAVFIFLTQIGSSPFWEKFRKPILLGGQLSFGIYLVHNIFIHFLVSQKIIGRYSPFWEIPVLSFLVFFVSGIIVYLLRKIKIIRFWM